jgi:hypothetical protein
VLATFDSCIAVGAVLRGRVTDCYRHISQTINMLLSYILIRDVATDYLRVEVLCVCACVWYKYCAVRDEGISFQLSVDMY